LIEGKRIEKTGAGIFSVVQQSIESVKLYIDCKIVLMKFAFNNRLRRTQYIKRDDTFALLYLPIPKSFLLFGRGVDK
jgi:hypothetical protein